MKHLKEPEKSRDKTHDQKTAAITKCYVRAADTFAIDIRDRRAIDSMFTVSSF
jgi:hypothetical protein